MLDRQLCFLGSNFVDCQSGTNTWGPVGGSDVALKSPNGYTKLPSGVIIQWGIATGICTGFTIALNTTYSTALISATAAPTATLSFYETVVYNQSIGSFAIANPGCFGGTYQYRWMAVGY